MARADDGPKIAVVDMQKVVKGHYETQTEEAKWRSDSEKAQKEFDVLTKDAQDLYNQIKEDQDQSNNPTATADAKAKAVSEGQQKNAQLQQKLQERQKFQNDTQQLMQQRVIQFRTMIVDEVSKVAITVAKRHGATLVLDRGSTIFADPSYDITQEVVDEINKNRPANLPALPAEPAAAPSSSSSSTVVPKITVPGVSQ
jgi:outer membrane protein